MNPLEVVELSPILKYGTTGICALLIIAGCFFVWIYYKKEKDFNFTLNNHFKHHTEAINRNTEMFGEIKVVMQSNIRTNERVCDKLDKV